MALLDPTWFTGLETAATTAGGIIAGAVGAFVALRKGWFSDSALIHLMKSLQEERDHANTQRDAALKVAKDTQDLRHADLVKIATLEVEKAACEQRASKCEEHARECQTRVKEGEERLVKQSEKLLHARMRASLFFQALVKVDPDTARRLGEWQPTEEDQQP